MRRKYFKLKENCKKKQDNKLTTFKIQPLKNAKSKGKKLKNTFNQC